MYSRGRYNNNQRFYQPRTPQKRGGTLSVSELLRAVEQSKVEEQSMPETEYIPQNKFETFAISDFLKRNIIKKGYKTPTPIQDKVVPIALEGKDVIGIANTGTGKTAAFLIPLVEKISKDKTNKALIIAPTRELALQIDEEFKSFSEGTGLRSVLCIGGANMFQQKRHLSYNPSFVIGTPGRIKDLMRQKDLDLSKFNNVVLDEADRMVDIGFIKEIKFLISHLPKERQSFFFSATISTKVQEILQPFVQNPVTISVKQKEAAQNVKQEIIRVSKKNKIDALHNLLIQKGFEKTLVFGRTKH